MGLIFCDSFDHYTSNTGKGWYGPTYITIGPTYARTGTNGFDMERYNSYWAHSLDAGYGAATIGFAFKGMHGSGSETVIGGFLDPVAYGNGGCIYISWVPGAGDLALYWGWSTGPQLITSIAGAAPWNQWHYIELSAVFSITATGKVVLRVDNAEIYRNEAVRNCGYDATPSAISFGQGGNAYTGYDRYIDDLYVNDTFDDFYGDVRVECKMPNGEGSHEEWVPNSSVHNYQCVDEIPLSTTDYVTANTADQQDAYAKAALTTVIGSVKAVAVNVHAQKTAVGPRTMATVATLGSNEEVGATKSLGTDWAWFQQPLDKPGGGSWTIDDVNDADLGIKLIA